MQNRATVAGGMISALTVNHEPAPELPAPVLAFVCAINTLDLDMLLATFAEDGPEYCSGLPVVRYSAEGLHSEFGTDFQLVRSEHEDHHTPGGAEQSFLYCLCRRE